MPFDYDSVFAEDDSDFDYESKFVEDRPPTPDQLLQSAFSAGEQQVAAMRQSPSPDQQMQMLLERSPSLKRFKEQIEGLPADSDDRKERQKIFDELVGIQMPEMQLEERAKKRGLSKMDQRIAETEVGKTIAKDDPVGSGLRRGVIGLGVLPQNLALRTMGAMGVRGAAEAADNNNRLLALQKRLDDANSRESALAEMTSPTVAEGVSAISEVLPASMAGGGVAGALKMTGPLAATKTLAVLYGASSYDQALTDAEDAGLSGAAKQAYAVGAGGLEAGIMLAFGAGASKFGAGASKFGLETTEEIFSTSMKQAATKLLSKAGVYEALKTSAIGMGAEAAEEGLTQLSQQVWGASMGAKTLDNLGANVAKAAILGGSARGIFGGGRAISRAFSKAVKMAPDTAKATVEAERFVNNATAEQVQAAETANTRKEFSKAIGGGKVSEVYQQAFQDVIAQRKADADEPEVKPPENAIEAAEQTEDQLDDAVDPTVTTARHKDLAADAESMGINGFYSPGQQTQRMWNAEAKRLGIPERALAISNSVLAQPRPLTAVEHSGLQIKWAALDSQVRGINRKLAEATDPVEIDAYGAELNRATEEAQVVHDALRVSGTAGGQAQVARRFSIDQNFSPLGLVARAKTAKRANLSTEELSEFRSLGQKYEGLADKVSAADLEFQSKLAMNILGSLNQKLEPADIRGVYKQIQEMFDGGCDL